MKTNLVSIEKNYKLGLRVLKDLVEDEVLGLGPAILFMKMN